MTISGDSFRAQPPPLKPTLPNLRPAPLGRRPAPARNRTPQTPVKEQTTNTVAKEAFSKEVHTASDPPTLNKGNTPSENVPKQHTFTPIQTISALHEVRDAHLQAITRLDAQIAKTETLAARIFQFSSTRKRLKQEVQTQKEIRDFHTGVLQEVEKQIALPSMAQGWKLSETQNSTKEILPLPRGIPSSPKELFVKISTYLDPIPTQKTPEEVREKNNINDNIVITPDQITDADLGTVLKDFARGAQRLQIQDGRSQSLGTVLFDGEKKLTTFAPQTQTEKLQAIGKIFKEELSLIGSLTLSRADSQTLDKLLTDLRADWGQHNDIEQVIGPAISAARRDGSFVGSTQNFYRLMNMMRTATRLDLLHSFVRALPTPENVTLNLSNPNEIAQFPYKTTIKPTDQGFELSIHQLIHVREKNNDVANKAVAHCELTVTYCFDKNMNLIELKGEPGEIIPEPETKGTAGPSATKKT